MHLISLNCLFSSSYSTWALFFSFTLKILPIWLFVIFNDNRLSSAMRMRYKTQIRTNRPYGSYVLNLINVAIISTE